MNPDKRVLIVDDDEAIRNLLGAVLRKRSLTVEMAPDGRHALDRLTAGERYDLILLDLMMPNLDGAGFLAHLSALPLEVRPMIVLITASHDADFDRVDQRMVAGLVRKPFDIFELADLVEGSIESSRRERGLSPGVPALEPLDNEPRVSPSILIKRTGDS